MRNSLQWMGAAFLTAAWLGAGCQASGDLPEDDDEETTTTGGGGQGGAGGGVTGPCEMDCSTIDAPPCHVAVCNTGMHPGPVNKCVVVPGEAGEACDDGLFCTVDDACDGMGVCVGGGENDCGMAPEECQDIVCDEQAKACTTEDTPEGAACGAEDLCVVGATCDAFGNCQGEQNDCFFAPLPNDCHVAVCNPMTGACEPQPGNFDEPCVDANDLCTIGKTCDMTGACTGGTPKDCSQLTQGCDLGVCDATTGQCTTMTVMDGQVCDDLDGCTTGELCSNGTCGGGTPITACSGAQTADGCCPSTCSVADDLDCATCTAGWDDGTLQGWTVTSNCSPQINWQPDSTRAAAGSHSLYYGDSSTQTFNCSGGAHQGTATSKVINLQPGAPNVTFSVFIDTEGGTTYDKLGLWVMPADVQVWDRNDFSQGASGNTNGQFIQQTVDLSSYANQSIQLQFRFNTVDSVANSDEGVYVDSLTAQGSCP